MSNAASENPRSEARSRQDRWLLIGGLIALLLLAVGLVYYWVAWNSARAELRDQSSDYYLSVYEAFLKDVEADRLEAAYQSTTAAFRREVSREAFNERARLYRAFKERPDARGVQSGASGPTGGDFRGTNQMVFTHTLEDRDGNQLKKSITLVQEDSIFYRRPPPPKIGAFTVEVVTVKPPGKP